MGQMKHRKVVFHTAWGSNPFFITGTFNFGKRTSWYLDTLWEWNEDDKPEYEFQEIWRWLLKRSK